MCAKNHDIVCFAKYLLVLEKYANYKTAPKLSQLQLILDLVLEPYYEKLTNVIWTKASNPRANGAKRRSGRKPGARVTNFALGKFKVIAHGS